MPHTDDGILHDRRGRCSMSLGRSLACQRGDVVVRDCKVRCEKSRTPQRLRSKGAASAQNKSQETLLFACNRTIFNTFAVLTRAASQ
jgi:hypothetical protein